MQAIAVHGRSFPLGKLRQHQQLGVEHRAGSVPTFEMMSQTVVLEQEPPLECGEQHCVTKVPSDGHGLGHAES